MINSFNMLETVVHKRIGFGATIGSYQRIVVICFVHAHRNV